MEELNAGRGRQHRVNLTGRQACTIDGVIDVITFNEGEVLLDTEQGMLMIKGNDLHVSRLSLEKGEVDVDGRVDSLTYSETSLTRGSKAESLIARLFK